MKKLLLLSLLSLISMASANAAEMASQTIKASNAYAHATPPKQTVSAAYLTLTNTGKTAQTLVAIYTPIAQQVQMHQTVSQNGMMTMVQQNSIALPAGQAFTFAPGNYHIMLIGLSAALKAGQTVPLTFIFSDGSHLNVKAPVKSIVDVEKNHHVNNATPDMA